ncbi:MAG: S1C family serine protease [Christensenellales bacterium]
MYDYNEYGYLNNEQQKNPPPNFPNPSYSGSGGNNHQKRPHHFFKAILWILAFAAVSASSICVYSMVSNSADKAPQNTITLPSDGQIKVPQPTPQTGGNTPGLVQEDSTTAGTNATKVAAKMIPSVVCIQNYQNVGNQPGLPGSGLGPGSPGNSDSLVLAGEGSGIILSADGYIVTNAHVVDSAGMLKVVLSDEKVLEAKIIGVDVNTDLAVVKVEATGLTPAVLGNSDDLQIGEYVMAVGNPGGLEFSSSVTFGIVSAVNRPLDVEGGYTMNTIQTDAAINPGNSGGALVNMNAQVVGISSAKYVATGFEGLGFAITINEALPIINSLRDFGKVQNRSMLGVAGTFLDSVTAQYYELTEGFYVESITNKNPGLLVSGDIITLVDGKTIDSYSALKNSIKDKPPGTEISVTFFRSSDKKTYTTKLILIEATQ